MRTAGLGLLIELAPDDVRGLRDIRAGVRNELGPGWSVGYCSRPRGRPISAGSSSPAATSRRRRSIRSSGARATTCRAGWPTGCSPQVEPDLPSSSYRLDGPPGLGSETVLTVELRRASPAPTSGGA